MTAGQGTRHRRGRHDGLYDLVADQEMAAAAKARPPPVACCALIELAKSRGGFDNITVQILKLQPRS